MTFSRNNLSTRLLVSVGIVLALFFGLTMIVLDMVFRDASERALRDRLDVQLLALISASDETGDRGLEPSAQLAEVRFNNPGSGLYGEIRRIDAAAGVSTVTWRSPSLVGTGLEFSALPPPGQKRFASYRLSDGGEVLALSMGLVWEFPERHSYRFAYNVAESREPYYAQLQRFRVQMFGWFSALMLALLAALAALFRRVLAPLRSLEQEIEEVEAGERQELSGGYPRELAGVTANMNTLLRTERERLSRYRNTLGNLAHSLKTPLAVMRSVLENRASPAIRPSELSAEDGELGCQVDRMADIVNYQLNRAVSSAGTALGSAPIDVAPLMQGLQHALLKVYADKRLTLRLEIATDCRFSGDAGDLSEIAGNLLDNACKWCRQNVVLTASPMRSVGRRREGLLIVVEDDGPGIPLEERQAVLARGTRLDERVSGQGIGLSVVRELVKIGAGDVEISASALGGARVTVTLPGLL